MTNVQRIAFAASLAVAPLALHAQTDSNGMPGSTTGPNNQTTPGMMRPGQDTGLNSSGGADAQAMRDKLFLRKTAQGSAAEIQLAQLALQKSANEAVKKFAQHMIDDHTAISQSLKPFADELGVLAPKPARMDQIEYDRLSGLAGADFDREYLADMVKDHQKDLQDFTLEAEAANDPELKEAVAKDQIVIARHTRMADRLAAALAGNK
jgi:putative membrane protein